MFGFGKPRGPLKRQQVEKMLENSESLAGADLSGLDLTGLEFSQTDLRGARLVNVKARGVEFCQCDAKQAVFDGAVLEKCEFSQCELQQSSFRGAQLVRVEFSQCEMAGAQLAEARVEECEFSQCEGVAGLRPEQQYKDFSDMEDAERWALARQRLGALAAMVQARYKEHPEDDEAEVVGHFQGRPYRVGVDIDFGSVEVELRCDNSVGTVAFCFDPAAKATPDADEWDRERGRAQRVFVAHGVYIDTTAAEVAGVHGLLQAMPGLGAHVGGWMPALGLEQLSIDAGLIGVKFKEDLLRQDLAQKIPQLLGFLGSLVPQFERGGSRVVAIARVFVGGQPVTSGGPRILCRYCGSSFVLGAQPGCPSCGAPALGRRSTRLRAATTCLRH